MLKEPSRARSRRSRPTLPVASSLIDTLCPARVRRAAPVSRTCEPCRTTSISATWAVVHASAADVCVVVAAPVGAAVDVLEVGVEDVELDVELVVPVPGPATVCGGITV